MAVHWRQYRLGMLPQGVVTTDEGERAYVDIPIGRMPLRPGDWIGYNVAWEPVSVVRKLVMETMSSSSSSIRGAV